MSFTTIKHIVFIVAMATASNTNAQTKETAIYNEFSFIESNINSNCNGNNINKCGITPTGKNPISPIWENLANVAGGILDHTVGLPDLLAQETYRVSKKWVIKNR